ncbi:MAG: hypothetical protein AUK06_00200 [Parcubacteria group bacterium CG2_30_36_18]|nr:MAG: hypothetical protein AUK06_00200 [Parcubacteria group bacterium CG2_30_36_18]
MPLRKTQLVNGEFYHIVKRGIEAREIFLDEEDHLRFVNSLLVFNDKNPTPWQSRAFWHLRDPAALSLNYQPKIPLVEIHTFALMKNHFHLLVRQLIGNGIAEFMQKLGGYVWYFNKKYKRAGTLFEGRYKIKRIETESQLKNNFVYIATNPVGIIEPEWKDWKVNNSQKAIQFLEEQYRWSSYWDYLGKENFPSVTTRDFFLKLFGEKEKIKNEIDSWILFKTSTQFGERGVFE